MVISSILTRNRQQFGIFKALGFRTGQIRQQLTFSLLPGVVISSLLAWLVCCFILQPLYQSIFLSIGVYQIRFAFPIWLTALIAIVLGAASLVIAWSLSSKAKKISVLELIRE